MHIVWIVMSKYLQNRKRNKQDVIDFFEISKNSAHLVAWFVDYFGGSIASEPSNQIELQYKNTSPSGGQFENK